MVAANFHVGRPKPIPQDPHHKYFPVEADKSVLGTTDWFMWFVLLMWMVVLYIVDLMFLNDREFVYDPNYSSWLEKCGYEHYRT